MTLASLYPDSWIVTCDDAFHRHRSLEEARLCTWIEEVSHNAPVHPVFLEGRTAKCAYNHGVERPSSTDLPFFEWLGEGSLDSLRQCANDGRFLVAHVRIWPNETEPRFTDEFVPRGGQEHDRFYCGCRGWD